MTTVITDEKIKEAEDRLKTARADKDKHKRRLDDYYCYAMPWRHQIDNKYDDSDVDNIFDSTAMDSVADFSADMLATYTPDSYDWIEPVPSIELSQADRVAIQPQIEEFNNVIFSEIRRSNFKSEALESYMDLTHGTMAMVTQDHNISQPIHCESIPANDLLIARGPYKTIDVKGYEMCIFADHIPMMWPDVRKDQDSELMRLIKDSPSKELKIMQSTWRDYSDRGTEQWKFCAYADNKYQLAYDVFKGQGSCPITVARWYTDSTTAWGIGPGYLKLPDIKTANLLVELLLELMENAVDPAYSYEDDGVINLENDIEPGTWIPRAPGSAAPEPMISGSNFDVAYFNKQELRESILRGFYQDKPLQRGKTPPSATQYLEEAADAARRQGAPGGRLIIEWQYEIYNRFAYLLYKRGKLPQVQLNGQIISLNANSPLIRAQRQEQALNVQRYTALLDSVLGPEMRQAIMNIPETAYFLKDQMGVKANILTSKKELEAIVEQIKQQLAQAAQGQQGGL